MFIILTIKLINKAMTIIDFVFAPAQMMMIGPKATLGKLLIIVKNGSIILASVGHSYRIIAIINPRDMPIVNANIVS